MRSFLTDLQNLKLFCIKYKINFGYELNDNHYSLIYDIQNGTVLELYFIKTKHVRLYTRLNPKHIIFPIKVKEEDVKLHIEELILHKFETHNIVIPQN